MDMSTKSGWLATTSTKRLQRRFEDVERTVQVDEIVAIQNDGRIVVMRANPEVVPGILAQKPAVFGQERQYFDAGQLRTLVSAKFGAGPGRVQDVKQLERSSESASKRRDGSTVGFIEPHP